MRNIYTVKSEFLGLRSFGNDGDTADTYARLHSMNDGGACVLMEKVEGLPAHVITKYVDGMPADVS